MSPKRIRSLSHVLFQGIADVFSVQGVRELAEFADSVSRAREGFLLFDDNRRIVLCNEPFLRRFRLPASPLGLTIDAIFGKGSALPGTLYSESFYACANNPQRPCSAEVAFSGSPGRTDGNCTALFLPFQADGKVLTLVCLMPPSGAERPAREGQGEGNHFLYEQNQELLRINAQLRIENAERSAVAQALRRAESRYRDIFDNATEGIFQWTPDRRLLSANISFARMMGYPTVNALFFSIAEEGFHFSYSPAAEKELLAELEQKGAISNFEFQVVRNDGTQLWASMSARRVLGPGGYTSYYEAFIENISSRKMTEEKLVYQAFHDPLTGLANRALFHDRLRMALRRAVRQHDYSFAVLYLDLDRFKMVNDSFGHNTGDDVLCHAAMEILSCVREVDTVARFGGDEFAVLIDDVKKGSYTVQVAKRIHAALTRPFVMKEQEINIGSSIGIVLKADRYELPEDILRDADTAMYRAKADPSIYFKIFSQKMRQETLESIVFENHLRQGIKDRDFYVMYQPVVSMPARELYGFEALLRWRHKNQVMNPAMFIPVAEEAGLIKELGLFVIEEVCTQIAEWKRRISHPFVTHLNISARQLVFPGFPRDVQNILERTGADPSWLLFEITESVLIDNGGACIQGIQQLRDMGLSFCLDDFGTGFSSLSYLRQLPLNCIKVDRSFVAELETDSHSLAIVRNLVTLGQDLGLSLIVEGVERQTQAEALLAVGCSFGQGFYFHKPLEKEEAEKLLTASGAV